MPDIKPHISSADAETLLLLILQVEIGRFLSADSAIELLNKLKSIKESNIR